MVRGLNNQQQKHSEYLDSGSLCVVELAGVVVGGEGGQGGQHLECVVMIPQGNVTTSYLIVDADEVYDAVDLQGLGFLVVEERLGRTGQSQQLIA